MVQFYFSFSLGSTSFLILSDVALDRFVAIRTRCATAPR